MLDVEMSKNEKMLVVIVEFNCECTFDQMNLFAVTNSDACCTIVIDSQSII